MQVMKLLAVLTLLASSLSAQPMLDAHNCYPEHGKYADRIERALSAGMPISIEQDLTYYVDPDTKQGRVVVSHTPKADGTEPTMKAYFFDHVKPLIEASLKQKRVQPWPLVILHLDFKSNEPELIAAVWDILGEYPDWISTSTKPAADSEVTKIVQRPILVLTETAPEQKAYFYDRLKPGDTMRIFGSAITRNPDRTMNRQDQINFLFRTPAQDLIVGQPTAYVRWVNFPWAVAEYGGQRLSADWTPEENARLKELVREAHHRGLKIRFYVENGHTPEENRGWTPSYNFGSLDAVKIRWKAMLDAGVDYLATDQYEELRAFMNEYRAGKK